MAKSLKSIIDKTRPFNFYYSGVEYKQYLKHVYDMGVRNMLISYEYARNKSEKLMEEYKDMGLKFFVDSGVFTYLSSAESANKSIQDWEAQIIDYLDWVEQNAEVVFACANLDIEMIVGNKQVEKWNRQYFEPFMLRTGIPVCFIWHDCDGWDGWERMCKRYPYVGFSGATEEGGRSLNELTRLLRVAQKHDAVVHGMGLTSTKLLPKLALYSVDSSVSGDSKFWIKQNGEITNHTLEEFYNSYKDGEIRTTKTETIISLKEHKKQVITVNSNNKVVWGKLKGIVKHVVKKPLIKLKLEGGREITCTTDHSLITMTNKGKLAETSANDLAVGDYVLAPSSFEINGIKKDFVDIMLYEKYQTEKTSFRVFLDQDFLVLLGMLVGDGFVSPKINYVGMSKCHVPECMEVLERVCDRYGFNVSVKTNGVDCTVSSVIFAQIINYFDIGRGAVNKKVPKIIFNLSLEQQMSFLSGYFSTDGTGCGEISSVSRSLIEDVRDLLEANEIYTSLTVYSAEKQARKKSGYANAKECYRLSITDGDSLLKFENEINFLQEFQKKMLRDVIEKSGTIRGSRRTCLPKEMATSLDFKIRTGEKRTCSVKHFKGRIDRKFREAFCDKVLDSQLNFLEVKEVESVSDGSVEVEVYDLSVEKYERFVANGILLHNTSWKVGLKYGLYNVWNGKTIKQTPKDDWQQKVLPFFKKYERKFDLEKLFNYDVGEVIKTSIYSYQMAEEYIRERLGAKMYWLQKKAPLLRLGSLVKRDEEEEVKLLEVKKPKLRAVKPVEDTAEEIENEEVEEIGKVKINYPSSEWLMGDTNFENWQAYAMELKIFEDRGNVKNVLNHILYATLFMQDSPLIDKMTEEEIDEIHDSYVNGMADSLEEKIEDLKNFFWDCFNGEKDDLSKDPMEERRGKLRPEPLTSEEEEIQELTKEEIDDLMTRMLPETALTIRERINSEDESLVEDRAEDIEELDRIIEESLGVQMVRDDKGRFLKGQRKVLNRGALLSKKYPRMICNTCYGAQNCPDYQEGFVCAYDKILSRFDTRNVEDVQEALHGIVDLSLERLQRTAIFERLDGGMPDANLTGLMNQSMNLLVTLQKLSQAGVLTKTKVLRNDGTVIEQVSMQEPKQGSLMQEIMNNVLKGMNSSDNSDAIDAEFKESE